MLHVTLVFQRLLAVAAWAALCAVVTASAGTRLTGRVIDDRDQPIVAANVGVQLVRSTPPWQEQMWVRTWHIQTNNVGEYTLDGVEYPDDGAHYWLSTEFRSASATCGSRPC